MIDIRVQQILSDLEASAEEKKALFDNRLKISRNPDTVMGIRVPLVRRAIKTLGKIMSFQDVMEVLYPLALEKYEYKLLFAGVAAERVSCDDEIRLLYDRLFECVDGWGTSDFFLDIIATVCEKHEGGIQIFREYVSLHKGSSNPFARRLTIVPFIKLMPKGYFSLYFALAHLEAMQNDNDYYVSMGIAWTLTSLYIHDEQVVSDFIDSKITNEEVLKLTRRKMRESRRVSVVTD